MLLSVIHHSSAGSKRHSAEGLVSALRSVGHDVIYQARGEPGVEAAVARPADAVVLAGGDGTVSKLLHLVVPRGLPIGILPLGTANNLARSLGIGGAVEEIAAGWRAERVTRLDVGVARGPWGERLFVDSAGAGAITQAMQDADQDEAPPGADRLARARVRIRDGVRQAATGGLEVVADGRPLAPDTLLAEATIIPLLGPRLPVAPGADPSDGLLDLVHARAGDREALAAWLSAEPGEPAPLAVDRVRSVTFRRTAGALRVGDTFEGCPGAGTVVEIAGAGLNVLLS